MTCSVEGCKEAPEKEGDSFCEAHWRALPHWARQELVRLRKHARLSKYRALDFMKAVAVARRLADNGIPREGGP